MIHRNTYVNAPSTLEPTFETRRRPRALLRRPDVGRRGLRRVGGLGAAGRRRRRLPRARARSRVAFPEDTALGALGRYIARSDPRHYQPTNIAFGLLPELPQRVRDKARRRLAMAERALGSLERFQVAAGRAESAPAPLPAVSRGCRAGGDRGLPPPPRARAQRLAAHGARLRRGPRAVRAPPARASSAASRGPQDVDHLLIRGVPGPAAPRGPEDGSAARKLATPAHLLPLSLPRGRARHATRPGRCSRRGSRSASRPISTRRTSAALVEVPGDGLRRAARPGDPGAALRHRHPLRRAVGLDLARGGPGARGWSECWAKAERSAWCRSAAAPAARSRPTFPSRPRRAADGRPLRQRAAVGDSPIDTSGMLVAHACPPGGARPAGQPPHAAAQLRDPPPGAGGRPASDPGAARATPACRRRSATRTSTPAILLEIYRKTHPRAE